MNNCWRGNGLLICFLFRNDNKMRLDFYVVRNSAAGWSAFACLLDASAHPQLFSGMLQMNSAPYLLSFSNSLVCARLLLLCFLALGGAGAVSAKLLCRLLAASLRAIAALSEKPVSRTVALRASPACSHFSLQRRESELLPPAGCSQSRAARWSLHLLRSATRGSPQRFPDDQHTSTSLT